MWFPLGIILVIIWLFIPSKHKIIYYFICAFILVLAFLSDNLCFRTICNNNSSKYSASIKFNESTTYKTQEWIIDKSFNQLSHSTWSIWSMVSWDNTMCIWNDNKYYTLVKNASCDWWKTPLGWTCNNGYEATNDKNFSDNWYCKCTKKQVMCNDMIINSLAEVKAEEIADLKEAINSYTLNTYNRTSVDNYNILVAKFNIKSSEYSKFLSEKCSCE